MNDALLSNYWGDVKIGQACPKKWEKASFNRLYTLDGRITSGEGSGGKWTARSE